MTESQEPTILAYGAFGRLREMQRVLTGGGFEAEIVNPPGSNANS